MRYAGGHFGTVVLFSATLGAFKDSGSVMPSAGAYRDNGYVMRHPGGI